MPMPALVYSMPMPSYDYAIALLPVYIYIQYTPTHPHKDIYVYLSMKRFIILNTNFHPVLVKCILFSFSFSLCFSIDLKSIKDVGHVWHTPIGGHRHRSRCGWYPTSDIDICYSDIGDKYVGLKNVILISEVFRYRHQSSFRYPTLKKKIFQPADLKPHPLEW